MRTFLATALAVSLVLVTGLLLSISLHDRAHGHPGDEPSRFTNLPAGTGHAAADQLLDHHRVVLHQEFDRWNNADRPESLVDNGSTEDARVVLRALQASIEEQERLWAEYQAVCDLHAARIEAADTQVDTELRRRELEERLRQAEQRREALRSERDADRIPFLNAEPSGN